MARAQRAAAVGEVLEATSLAAVAGAEVLLGGEVVARTSEGGRFRFEAAPGVHLLLVRGLGYTPTAAHVTLGVGDTLTVQVLLHPAAVVIDSIVIVAPRLTSWKAAEFYERRERGLGGQFLTHADIERRNPMRLSDLFRSVRGLRVECINRYCSAYRLSTSLARAAPSIAGGPCRPQVYLDGAYYVIGSEGIDVLDPQIIEGIEVYVGPSQVPAQFSGVDARCGVVVIWTRDG